MCCREVKEKLYEFIYGELNDEQAAFIKQHLGNCQLCRAEYEELKGLLLDDIEPILEFKKEAEMPIELEESIKMKLYLEAKVNSEVQENVNEKESTFMGNKAKKSFMHQFMTKRLKLGWYAAACLIFLLVSTIPAAAYYINQNSLLDKYREVDPKIVEEFDGGKGQLIGKTSTMKDIDFTIDGIMKEKNKTTILFTAKYPKDSEINYAMPYMGMNAINVEDQFGRKYDSEGAAWTLRSTSEDGVTKGIMYVKALKPGVVWLNIRVTAMEIGKISVDTSKADTSSNSNSNSNGDSLLYKTEKYKNVYGNWHVSFYVK